ncbi:MAG: pyridoxal phosphate-dependent aminotransferase [Bdellovibrionales bacterium]|nr:pyridoxal phosphate-dependent aminotransferase [Bdellovibrionales bacterium]
MPYIEFATKYYANPKINLAMSDVPHPDYKEYLASEELIDLIQTHPHLLMEKLVHIIAQKYGVKPTQVKPTQVELTMGVTNSFSIVGQVMKDFGHTIVLSECPGYEPLWLTPEGLGFDVVEVRRELTDYSFDLNKLDDAAKNNSWLWLTNPHNPSGRYLNLDEMKEITEVMKKNNSYVFVDEIYHDFCTPLGKDSAVNVNDNVVISNGITKTYGLGTYKIGWMVGPEEFIKRARIARLHQFMLVPGPSLALTYLFMKNQERVRENQITRVLTNRNYVKNYLSDLDIFIPTTGPISLLKLPKSTDDVELAKRAIHEHGLVLSPGYFFKHPGYLRISYAGYLESIKKGLEVLKTYL